MRPFGKLFRTLAVSLLAFLPLLSRGAVTNDYSAVSTIFAEHCLDCHAAQEPEGKLVMETFDALMKGGESGAVLKQGDSSGSLLVKVVEGTLLKDGKKWIMPPGKRKKLTSDEITTLKSWIDSGALPPKEPEKIVRELKLPIIKPSVPPRRSIQAMEFAASPKLIAAARYGEVDLISSETRAVVRTLKGHRGSVNAIAFTADGKRLAAAAGEPALFGEVRIWNVADGKLVRTIEGHKDALYAVAISPDGQTLATGSYDQKIKLWELATGKELQTLSAHNGAIYDLAFRPDGKILASASGDRTVKLWTVATGKRVETFSQPLKEQYALSWSPDGKRLAAGGADNRIRVWEISASAAETTNPLLVSKFAHEGAILNIAFSPDGKTILSAADDLTLKSWDAKEVTEKLLFEKQPDITPGIAFMADGKRIAVGRQDGSVAFYEAEKPSALPPPAPELKSVSPRGLSRGKPTTLKLAGANFLGVTNVVASHPNLRIVSRSVTSGNEVQIVAEAGLKLPRGEYELSVRGPGGESGKVKVFIDNLPQLDEAQATNVTQMPLGIWGVIDVQGDKDEYQFEARAGQMLVLELAVKSIGSKLANGLLTLLDERGAVLASDSGFDGDDRFVAFKVAIDGRYTARVTDQMLAASKEHFYRLSIGELPVVTGVFPLSIGTNAETALELSGYNLPGNATVKVKTGDEGELDVPLDDEPFRKQRTFKVAVRVAPQIIEREPNDQPGQATVFAYHGAANGRIGRVGDVDFFRFEAKVGEPIIVETDAAARGSAVDTRIEILHADGRPVARTLLHAVRNTAINFRSVDSNGTGMRLDNYEEMELTEYLYMNGDVMRLFRMPQGPDSDMMMFTSAGRRRAYFDTTAVAHALDEQGFIVEPHPTGTKLPANGLPVFTLHFENDDDGERKLGSDSKVQFTAPTNGTYHVRVTDTRGHGGDTFAYRLIARTAKPDFTVSLSGANPTVSPGSGQSFTVTAERLDGFDGDIRVEIGGLPEGFIATSPVIIEAGHAEAKGSIHATIDAPKPAAASATKVVATAMVGGSRVTKDVNNFGTIKLGDKPKLYVSLEPYSESATNRFDPAAVSSNPLELTIAPGQTIPAWLKIHRNGHQDLVTFFAENLPHGVIVADIGLNGVLIPKGESERQIFFNAAKWVPEQDRLFYMIEQQVGRQTSRPVLLKVRKAAQAASAK